MAIILPQKVEKVKLRYSKEPHFVRMIVSVFADGETYISKETWLKMLDGLPDDHLIYHLSVYTRIRFNEVKVYTWDA